jgi:hypothetical protein
LGGLTLSDYNNIAKSDPFYRDSSFDPNSDSKHRFTYTGQSIDYIPAAPGDGAMTWPGSLTYVETTTDGQSASDSYKVSYNLDAKIAGALGSAELTASDSMTWMNKWSESRSYELDQVSAYSITGPLASDNYSGPTSFEVFEDNVYGTFMFYSPGSTPVSAGSIGVSPSGLYQDFGSVSMGKTSAPITFTLKNNATESMFMGVSKEFPFTSSSTATASVAAFSDPAFSVVSGTDKCTGVILAPASTCTLAVQFKPLASDVPGSGGVLSGGMYLTAETIAAVQDIERLNGTVAAASGAAATPTITTTCPRLLKSSATPYVSMDDKTTGATVYYTTNGKTPTTSSTKYTGTITVDSVTITFKSIAVAPGYTTSAVATETVQPTCAIEI